MKAIRTLNVSLLLTALAGLAACGASDSKKAASDMPEAIGAIAMNSASTDYKRELPEALVTRATITEANAANIARGQVPNGVIESVELEEEDGVLLYSYDLRVPNKSGIDEVHVNAMTGAVIKVAHESPEDEKAEADEDEESEKGPGK